VTALRLIYGRACAHKSLAMHCASKYAFAASSIGSNTKNVELQSMAKRLVERLTKATAMAEVDIEHEFETLYQRLVASLDGLREAVAHANRVLDRFVKKN
jgi:hypothetical protein